MSKPFCIVAAALAVVVCQGCVSTTSGNTAEPERAARANLDLGVEYMRRGQPERALEALEDALEYDPRLAAAHSTIAIVYEQLGDPETAEEHYRRATQLGPDDGSAANSYAVFLCRNGRWSDAEVFFRRAASNVRYPTPAAALTNAGVCARTAGDMTGAEAYFREALTRDARFPDALYHMADLSYLSQDYLAGRAFTQRYLAAVGRTPEILLLCVRIERALDAAPAAAACADQLRRSFPNSAEIAQLTAIERNEPR